ncbi:MAG: MFS transporter [Acidobacteria bacterium]|nr:MFS transporter [Acidobacteriota bacterium]
MNQGWALVLLLWVVALLNYLDRQVIFSLLPLLRGELNLSDSEIGLLGAVFLWVYAACSLFAGWVAQRFGHRRVILASLGAWSIVTALTGISSNFMTLGLTRAAMGITEAFYIPAALALVAAALPDAVRSRAVSLHQSGIYMGILLGGGPGAAIGQAFGWRNVFFLLGAIGCLYGLFLLKAMPAPGVHSAATPDYGRVVRSVAGARGFWPVFAIFAAISFANWMVATWMPLYLYDRFQFSLQSAGLSATVFTQIPGLAGMAAGSFLADRLARRSKRGRAFAQAVGLLTGGLFLLLGGFADTAPLFLGALMLYSFGRGMYDCNVMPVLCDVVAGDERSTAYSLLNFAGTFVGGVAAYGAGALRSGIGLEGALMLAAVLVLASAALSNRIASER